jgi:hypothetical protein
MLDRSPQPNLFDPGRAGEPARQATAQAPHVHFHTPPPARPRRGALSPARYLAAVRAAMAPVVAGRLSRQRLRLLAPVAILLLLVVLNPAGCSRGTSTRVVTRTTVRQEPETRVVTRLVTRTVTVRQSSAPASPPRSRTTAAPSVRPARTSAAQPALIPHSTASETRQPAVTTPPPSSAAVTPTRTATTFADSPPDPRREGSGEEFGFER